MVLQQAHVPRNSVRIVVVGSGRSGIAAVQSGQVHAVSAGVLTTVRVLSEVPGSKVLVAGFDSQRLLKIYAGKPYPGGVLVATDRWLQQHPGEARTAELCSEPCSGFMNTRRNRSSRRCLPHVQEKTSRSTSEPLS
jgi:ABC-type nitrate/sulfonate/bicarbonate transport system substrate-binding protein